MKRAHITIVGAGPVGALLALQLGQRGHLVTVLERRADPRVHTERGRSINLALSDRGLLALQRAGVKNDVVKETVAMGARAVHDERGTVTLQPYGRPDQAILSTSRGGLNARLLDLAEHVPGVQLRFGDAVAHVDVRAQSAMLMSGERVDADVLVGADGAFSVVRQALQRLDRFDFQQSYLPHGYLELTIPADDDGTHVLEKHALHIWPRGEHMLIALPNTDGSFTCTLFLPFEGKHSFQALPDVATARAFFARTFPDALALMPTFDAEWVHNPTSSLVTVRAHPWTSVGVGGRTLLIGDAAHAIVPFYGQGLNAGFEDCRVLMEILQRSSTGGIDDWARALTGFQEERQPNADAISQLAQQNFVEMREQVRDPHFLLKKKIEARAAQLCPDRVIPLYAMVTFTPEMPYQEALQRGRKQDAIFDELARIPELERTLHAGTHDDMIRRWVIERLAE